MPFELFELPDNWIWVKLGDICQKPQYGWTTSASDIGKGPKLLRTTDISSGIIDWKSVPYCEEAPEDIGKYLLQKGDILVSRAGSVGISIEIEGDCPKAVFASYLIRFRPLDPISPRYISFYLMSPYYWNSIADNTAGIAIPNVNATKLQSIDIPLPPLREQSRILAKMEQLFCRVNRVKEELLRIQSFFIEGRLVQASKFSDKLSQAILAKAFRGGLVPQDPDDEPASVLLEKIKATSESRDKARKRG